MAGKHERSREREGAKEKERTRENERERERVTVRGMSVDECGSVEEFRVSGKAEGDELTGTERATWGVYTCKRTP